jgi:N-acetylmuramoyl-L-alanine amidase
MSTKIQNNNIPLKDLMSEIIDSMREEFRKLFVSLCKNKEDSRVPGTDIEIDFKEVKSKNLRIKFLVLHYTALPFKQSLKTLTEGAVSAHYLIPEEKVNGHNTIFQLVKDADRAWHAGVSAWGSRTNLNDTSIGIEVVNLGYTDDKEGKRTWHPFTAYQKEMLCTLTKNLVTLYKIEPTCVLGHSDISPGRKVDPGPLFPWRELADSGVGAWPDSQDIEDNLKTLGCNPVDIVALQCDLKQYGYPIECTGTLDAQTRSVVQSFHMHFLGTDSQEPTAKTHATILALIGKYSLP